MLKQFRKTLSIILTLFIFNLSYYLDVLNNNYIYFIDLCSTCYAESIISVTTNTLIYFWIIIPALFIMSYSLLGVLHNVYPLLRDL